MGKTRSDSGTINSGAVVGVIWECKFQRKSEIMARNQEVRIPTSRVATDKTSVKDSYGFKDRNFLLMFILYIYIYIICLYIINIRHK